MRIRWIPCAGACFLIIAVLFLALLAHSQKGVPQIPPEIDRIMKKMEKGQTPTPEEQKTLQEWAESMSRAFGGQRERRDKEEKKEEIVLSVRVDADAQSTYDFTFNGPFDEKEPLMGTYGWAIRAG